MAFRSLVVYKCATYVLFSEVGSTIAMALVLPTSWYLLDNSGPTYTPLYSIRSVTVLPPFGHPRPTWHVSLGRGSGSSLPQAHLNFWQQHSETVPLLLPTHQEKGGVPGPLILSNVSELPKLVKLQRYLISFCTLFKILCCRPQLQSKTELFGEFEFV